MNIGIALFALIAIGFLSNVSAIAGGEMGKLNDLIDSTLVIGKSTADQMRQFSDGRGLSVASTWRGYKVVHFGGEYRTSEGNFPYQLVDGNAVLSGFSLILYKEFPGQKVASINNLKHSLRPECGDWKSATRLFESTLMVEVGDVKCMIMEGAEVPPGQVMVSVTPRSS